MFSNVSAHRAIVDINAYDHVHYGSLQVFSYNCSTSTNAGRYTSVCMETGELSGIKYLISRGIKPLWAISAAMKHFHVLDYLKTIKMSPTWDDFEGIVRFGSLLVVKHLIEYGFDIRERPEMLMYAPNRDMVKLLMSYGVWSDDALRKFMRRGNMSIIKYIASLGINITTPDILEEAVYGGRISLVKYLIAKGARLDECKLFCPGNLNMVKFLVSKGCDIIKKISYSRIYDIATCEYIIENVGKDDHRSLMCGAIFDDNMLLIELLLSKGVRATLGAKCAMYADNVILLKYFIRHGVDMDEIASSWSRTLQRCGRVRAVRYVQKIIQHSRLYQERRRPRRNTTQSHRS